MQEECLLLEWMMSRVAVHGQGGVFEDIDADDAVDGVRIRLMLLRIRFGAVGSFGGVLAGFQMRGSFLTGRSSSAVSGQALALVVTAVSITQPAG